MAVPNLFGSGSAQSAFASFHPKNLNLRNLLERYLVQTSNTCNYYTLALISFGSKNYFGFLNQNLMTLDYTGCHDDQCHPI
jgi:hypothetical protein